MKDFDYYYDLFMEMFDLYEFDLSVDEDNCWRVIDRQGGNLGGIEQEQFETLSNIIDRMEAYHNDYIVEALEMGFPEIEYLSWEDLYNQIVEIIKQGNEDLSDFEFDIRVLDMILNSESVLSDKKENEKMKMIWRKNNE